MSSNLTGLAGQLAPGAVVTDDGVIEGYRRDRAATVPAGRPRAVIRPGTVAEVSSTLRWATRNSVPVVPRGAGTGLSGGANAIDGCLVLSLERFTAIREISAGHQYAVVEAGVLNAAAGRAAAAAGMFYPPDPGSFQITTIGGNLATNAGGMRCVKYGVTRDSALGLEMVLADGTILRTGSGARKDVAGYDLTSLFIGSEGTLGVITSATLRIRPRPPRDPVTFVASFPELAATGHAVDAIAASGVVPSMLELGVCAAVDVHYLSTGAARAAAVPGRRCRLRPCAGRTHRSAAPRRTLLARTVLPARDAAAARGPGRAERAGPADRRRLRRPGPGRPPRPGRACARRVRHHSDRGGQVPVPHRHPHGPGRAPNLGAPLFITAAGMPAADAADLVRHMAGRYRLPGALRRADALARADPAQQA